MNIEISLEERLAAAEQRISDLARQKSRHELVNSMLMRLAAASGLENVAKHILTILMETIGASNIHICFNVEGNWKCLDLFGVETVYATLQDSRITETFTSGSSARFEDQPVANISGSTPTEAWVFPLFCKGRAVGAVVMEQMQLTHESIMQDIQPFFIYAAMMLDNEINNFSLMASAHRTMKESEELHRTLFEESLDGLFLVDPQTMNILLFNASAHRNLGYSREEFAGMRIEEFEIDDTPEIIKARGLSLLECGFAGFEARHRTKYGEIRNVLMTLTLVSIEGKERLYCVSRDITERKRTEESMALMSYALDHIQEAAYLIDEHAGFRYVNAEACRAHGVSREKLLGMSVHDVDPNYPRERWPFHWQELKRAGSATFESIHTSLDGNRFPVEINTSIFHFGQVEYSLSLVRNISDRKQAETSQKNMEQQLLQTQKLESLGVLAGGIAHDFNNILMAIMGNAELAKMRLRPESPAVDNLDRIEKSAARAADLAKQMLAYSGKGKFMVEQINMNHLLEEMLHLLEVSISKKAILRFNLNDNLPNVKADATQMRQIVMNLVINASEAIGDKSGVIAITTGCMDCDQSYLKNVWLDENLVDGLYVYLEIADTGCGMDRVTLDKLFDPFFTTKFTGRGLGMSAVLGIVRGHHGAIKVYSEVGKGTTFKILLPASNKPAELFNGHNINGGWKGSGTVLLVDDEETVRGIGVEMLKELGFSTITATDGRDALEKFREHPEIDFVILDLTMPKMDGERCFRELRQLKHDIKVIMSSGYSEQEVSEKFLGKGVNGFIQKPYRLSVLQDAIKKI